ncbi:MAG: hypothetical protein ABI910_10115 [Gemmatimonadota bacterium]
MKSQLFTEARIAPPLAVLAVVWCLATPLAAQDYRVAGGMALPRGGDIGGQMQASVELGPRTSGFGLRVDVLYSQTPSRALSIGDLVSGGQSHRTMAAVGGLFYRHEVRDFAPYVVAGGGAYEQSGSSGIALGVHGGVGVDYAGNRYRPFVEARLHRLHGDAGADVLQRRERSLVSALVGVRF